MGKGFVNLGELFPDKHLRCRVPGCNNLWKLESDQALAALASKDGDLPDKMCERCFELFKTLEDREVECSNPDCSGSWRWTRFEQVISHVRGFTSPPPKLCETCRQKTEELENRNIPCRMKHCDHTWLWTAKQQLLWRKKEPPSRLCDDCKRQLKELKPQEVPCRVRGCENSWTWTPYQQLEHGKAGKDPEKPPRRMCRKCFETVKEFEDMECSCKIDECKRTWTFSAYAQLENRLRRGEDATPPDLMCRECFEFYKTTKDREMPCRNRGCRNTWTYTRGWQLRDWLQGRTRPPSLMCSTCNEKRKQRQDLQKPCQ